MDRTFGDGQIGKKKKDKKKKRARKRKKKKEKEKKEKKPKPGLFRFNECFPSYFSSLGIISSQSIDTFRYLLPSTL